MTRACSLACAALILAASILANGPLLAETTVTVTGVAPAAGGDTSPVEKRAFEDALAKAYLLSAIRHVPSSSIPALSAGIGAFVTQRAGKDVIRYKVISKSQSQAAMMVTYDVTIDDEPLKAWLAAEKLSTPVFMRPKVLLAITTRGPRPQERHEWWTQPTPASYSPFEEVMARRLRSSGENVIGPPAQKALSVKTEDWALVLGRQAGADIVVYGLLTHTRPEGTTVNSRLDLFVADVRSNSRLASTSLTLRGSLDVEVMNELVVSAVWEQVRSAIVARTVSFSPASREKTLCIQGMRDNEQYQEILGAIRSLGIVSSVTVSGISGRKLCHTVRTAADLQEVMRGLSQRLAIQADMEVDEDTALLRVLN